MADIFATQCELGVEGKVGSLREGRVREILSPQDAHRPKRDVYERYIMDALGIHKLKRSA